MKILVTGATGFIGKNLLQALKNQDISLVVTKRSNANQHADLNGYTQASVDDFQWVDGDLDTNTDWRSALSGCDVVIHLAARVHVMHDQAVDPLSEYLKINVKSTENLAKQAIDAGVKRFIFLSTVKVNGEFTNVNQKFTELDEVNPQDDYAQSKYQAEQMLFNIAKNSTMDIVVIRPPLVYGAGVKANFANLLTAIKRGIPLPLGAINNQRSFVYVGNLVSLIRLCIHHPAAANEVFLVSDGADISTATLIKYCANMLGVKARLFSVPKKWVEAIASLLGKTLLMQRLYENLQVDISKARTTLDWSPLYSVDEALKATAQAFNEMKK